MLSAVELVLIWRACQLVRYLWPLSCSMHEKCFSFARTLTSKHRRHFRPSAQRAETLVELLVWMKCDRVEGANRLNRTREMCVRSAYQ